MGKRFTIVMPSARSLGGAEEALKQLVYSASAKDHLWQIIFLENGPMLLELRCDHVQTCFVSIGRTRNLLSLSQSISSIRKHLLSFRADVVLGWMTKGHVYGGIAAKFTKSSVAWFQHGTPDSTWLDYAAKYIPTSKIFVASSFVAKLQQEYQPKSCIDIVPVGVDAERFDPKSVQNPKEAKRSIGLNENVPVVGIVARLQRWKGVHTLIEAMTNVLKEFPDAKCIVVGGPHKEELAYESYLRTLVNHLRLTDCVIFAGAQNDVPRWMQAMDVVVHASQHEPYGIVVLESLSLGKPTICCVPGGLTDFVVQSPHCKTFQFDDASALADNITELLDSSVRYVPEHRLQALQFSKEIFAHRLTSLLVDLV